jgi:hypothetical protein
MKRFKIKNTANGLTFQVERETIEPMQPEWGRPQRELREQDAILQGEDISKAISTREDVDPLTGEPVRYVTLAAEYVIEEEDITGLREREQANAEALAYLASTDWLIIREMDEGTPCPADVKAKRAEARAKIQR